MNIKEVFRGIGFNLQILYNLKHIFKGKISFGEFIFLFCQDMSYFARLFRYKLIGVDIARGRYAREAIKMNSQNSGYMETRAFMVKGLLKNFSITPEDKIFDYGSGKGFALILFSKYPFGEIGGVELVKELHDAAVKNFSRLKLNHVKSYNEDATKFEKIDQFNYFYVYNPFMKQIFEAVIQQIANSLSRNPRKIIFIYNRPVEKDFLINSGLFPYYKEIPFVSLYKSKFVQKLAFKRYKNRSVVIFSNEPLDML